MCARADRGMRAGRVVRIAFAIVALAGMVVALPVSAAPAWATTVQQPEPGQGSSGDAAPVASESYRIGARDVLEVRVFNLEDLNTSVRVSEAGTISLPLIGEMVATQMTQAELEAAIEARLSEYVNDPQVFIFIREYESQKYSVMGAVGAPGTYQMFGRVKLLEALSNAGGIQADQASGMLTIIREGFTGEPIQIDLAQLIDEANTAYNIELKPGDVINVEPKRAFYVYVYGQVNAPGSFQIREAITLLQAVSMAGGLAERAAADRVRIVRKQSDGTQEVIEVNLNDIEDGEAEDVRVFANDIIIVPSTFF